MGRVGGNLERRLVGYQDGRVFDWLVGRVVGRLVSISVGRFCGWVVGRDVGRLCERG